MFIIIFLFYQFISKCSKYMIQFLGIQLTKFSKFIKLKKYQKNNISFTSECLLLIYEPQMIKLQNIIKNRGYSFWVLNLQNFKIYKIKKNITRII